MTEAAQPRPALRSAGRSKDRLGSALILTGVILLALVAAGWGWLWWSQRDERAARAEAEAVAEAEHQAIEHIHRWARAVVESRRTLDPSTLDGIYEPGGDFEKAELQAIRNLRSRQQRMEFTREIRSIEVKESSRDRVVAIVVWEDALYEFKDLRTGELVRTFNGQRKTNRLEVRLIGGRWLITDNVVVREESLPVPDERG